MDPILLIVFYVVLVGFFIGLAFDKKLIYLAFPLYLSVAYATRE